ncbi:MAG: exodeoxyribonuclease VII large subunit [Proteobacteria bacterium]|nr:exodeoxyribonuclease VII large subunit [Pseudomonadota bacterium]
MSLNIPEFTVSEFSRSIKTLVEDAFGYVRIKGEITGFKRASSGHLYFNLKDETAALSAVCFRNAASLVNFEIADGLQVCASGRITTFEGRSNYQIIIEKLEIAGIGAILEMLSKRKEKLLAEGLFDQIHKKPIPFFPKIIGVITSETGAVLQDIKHRVEARCPTHLKLYPVLVQGEKSAAEIITALKFFAKLKGEERPDVLIVARGGGSFEDLLPFNDEALVRAVFASEIPIISAVGHETDTTLIDYVADLRAPTPTAAAELATPILSDLKNRLNFLDERLNFLAQNFIAEKIQQLKNLQKYIVDPAKILLQMQQNFLAAVKRFDVATTNFFEKKSEKLSTIQVSSSVILHKIKMLEQKIQNDLLQVKSRLESDLKIRNLRLENLNKLLKTQHYGEILKRGFALIKNEKGQLISSIDKIKAKEKVTTQLADGEFSSYVLSLENKGSNKKDKNNSEIIQPKFI